MRLNCFDEDDYGEFDMAMKIFESMDLPNDTDFYWACMHVFKKKDFGVSTSLIELKEPSKIS